jgi:putative hydroxymethylpyrimidine transport system permease protein
MTGPAWRVVRGGGTAIVLIGGWQAVVVLSGAPHYILPGPGAVARVLVDNAGLLAGHAGITLAEVLIGLVLGAGLGAGAAVLLALSRTVSATLGPLLLISQAVPVFALAPILTLWLGYGMAAKAAMAVLIIFFPVVSAFHDGLMRLAPGFEDLSRVMGASRWREMRHLRIPAAAPALASGLRIAAVYAPIGAVIGEWVGASGGLGYLMLLANGRAKTDLMFAAVAVLAAMTLTLHWGVGRIAARLSAYGKG